jgi:hypothetical protein
MKILPNLINEKLWKSLSLIFFLFLLLFTFSLLKPGAAEAGQITDISLSVNTATKSATATYSATFTVENEIPSSGGRINLEFFGPNWNYPNFNSATVGSETSPNTISIYSRSYNYIIFSTSQAISAGTEVTLKIENSPILR